MTAIRPRRSALYIPGSNERALDKVAELEADVIILDLEDAVAPQAKGLARAHIAARLAGGGFAGKEVMIRVNGLETAWGREDLEFCARVKPDAVLVPKVGSASTIMMVAHSLDKLGAAETLRIWAMVETPLAILNIANIGMTAIDPASRLSGLVMGINDLIKETRAKLLPGRANLMPWLTMTLAAARAYGLCILDGVYNTLDDETGLANECRQAADLGFDGKTLIHPRQIDAANAAFSPSDHEVEYARAVIALFEQPGNADKGAVSYKGQMVERLHADIARETVAISEAIAARG